MHKGDVSIAAVFDLVCGLEDSHDDSTRQRERKKNSQEGA